MRNRLKEWLWRYGPAELVSLPATLLPALLVQNGTGDAIAAALAGTWGGNIGYFGTILLRDVWLSRRRYIREKRRYGLWGFGRNVRALLIEFGVAELLDSLLVRPALMYYLPKALDNFSWGIIAAKFAADLSFYLPAILFYELSKKHSDLQDLTD
jgi:hypothetical protein